MTSTYLGSITIVLKFPLTSAASAKGLHRYNGFEMVVDGDGGTGGGFIPSGGKVAEVGVGERLGARGARLLSLRLNNSVLSTKGEKKGRKS